MRAALTLIALACALVRAGPAQAIGFGRVVSATQLGQPLNFAAAIRLEADEALPRECVSAEVFSGDNKLQPGQVRVTLEGTADAVDRSVHVTTTALIDEPVVTINVTVGCTAKVTRRFVAFLDPPPTNLASSTSVDAASLPPQRVDSQVAPLVDIVQGSASLSGAAGARDRSKRAAAASVPRAPVRSTAVAAAPSTRTAVAPVAATPRKPSATPRQALAPRTPPKSGGSRLELEAAPAAVAQAASAATPIATPAAALVTSANAMPPPQTVSAASVDEQGQLLEKERQRIAALEQGMSKLHSDAQAMQQSVAALQARLREAESARYANPLVYALAWLSGLLALGVAALWWRQARAGGAARWWAATGLAQDSRFAGKPAPAEDQPAIAAPSTMADMFDVSKVVEPDSILPAPAASVAEVATRPAPIAPAAEPTRELSVEELIDLEQQAEFFIVLGQDEAAIELLMSHVRSNGGISPLPHLKLLEIYRRRGDRDAYERIRERFNRRFNAYAPDWDVDLQQGRSLAEYPDIVSRLQGLWPTPPRAMETIDASLFRRNESDDTFDLPAYRELLLLYSVARDLAEQGAVEPQVVVDLMLPFSDDASAEPNSRLMAASQNGAFVNSEMMRTMPLDLDVNFDTITLRGRSPDQGEASLSGLRHPGGRPFVAESGFLDFDLDEMHRTASSVSRTSH